jgi:D-alanyl-lipoteichoic acid acyltransferase DltB (MBOAT superfamily)
MNTEPLYHVIHNITGMLVYVPSEPMLFSGGVFWGLFLLFLPIYSLLKRRKVQMMLFTALFSLYFYYKSSGLFVLLLLGTSVIDWSLARWIAQSKSRPMRRWLLALSIGVSVSILGYFKYANFVLWNWSLIVSNNFHPLDVVLPVGISFYTFQSISYVVDVYNGKIQPRRVWLEYLFYLSFFPALVAGPIVRADRFFPQLDENRRATYSQVFSGLWLVILGVIKKAVVADYIAQYNDLIFNNPGGYSGIESLMAVLGYTMQIYCDFSGYSDMAIGIALTLGFDLGENFRLPYQSRNVTEFWHRWHISLSSWLRDYIYIPLGGSRRGKFRTYCNLMATMLVGGLWHGASWQFVCWGGMHGVGLVVHKMCKPWLDKVGDHLLTNGLSRLLTLGFVSLLWVFFRADSLDDAITILRSICCNFQGAQFEAFVRTRLTWCVLMAIMIVAHGVPTNVYMRLRELFVASPWLVKLLLFLVTVQLVIEFMSTDVVPFIYFRF